MSSHLLLALLALALAPALFGEGNGDYVPEVRNTSETFGSKVLRIYACQEGDIHYTAYVVSWRGHEVVVTPSPVDASANAYQVGDPIRCRMHHLTRKTDAGVTAHTQFVLARGGEDEHARLEAIEAAVQSRRALRDAIRSPENATPPRQR